ncbi:hypothetical protein TKK_0010023 [Trichogramma kaykai]
MLTTAIVTLTSDNGLTFQARALLDPCSEESYVSENVAKVLELDTHKTLIAVNGLGNSTSAARGWVNLTVKSPSDADFEFQIEALTMSRLTSKLPSAPIDTQSWTHLHNLDHADPFHAKPSPVDCLLGVDVVAAALRPGLITGPAGTPTALNTVFGWVLMGKGQQQGSDVTQAFSLTVNHELSTALEAFWEVEEISAPKLMSPEDTQCYEHFKENIQRDHTGRFIVRLPLVKTPALSNSKNNALGALRRMERRLENNAELREAYNKFMAEYAQLQHMSLLPDRTKDEETAVYIPHHPVRILWRDSPDKPVKHYSLNTVTYGTVSAPFLANACMLELATQEAETFPLAAKILQCNRYADDFFVGDDSESNLITKADELVKILKSAAMDVGKWASNSRAVIEQYSSVSSEPIELKAPTNSPVSVLGLLWTPNTDTLHYHVPAVSTVEATKRGILSAVAKLYNPLGFLSPVIIRAKILLQDLWLQAWREFQEDIVEAQLIKIPRWISITSTSRWDLYGFCDASQKAYAAAVYAVVYDAADNPIGCHLLIAKTKVSPIKVLNIPRLELQGAVLLVRLVNFVNTSLQQAPSLTYCWTDSNIVLAWLRSHPSRWKTFTANRVSEIHTLMPNVAWRHVPSKENPSNCASRGISDKLLIDHALWWHGPTWLLEDPSTWPPESSQELQTDAEQRTSTLFSTVNNHDETDWQNWFEKFSSLHKIVRILAYTARFQNNATKGLENRTGYLTAREMAAGQERLWRIIQYIHFRTEIDALMKGCLNSRPLGYLSSNEEDPIALTPGHFLIRSAIISLPDKIKNAPSCLTAKWELVQKMRDDFWARWSQEHLTYMQQRSKWIKPQPNVQVGDVVLVKNELQPASQRLMGRFTRCYYGDDGLCRVALVHTTKGEYRRPMSKLILLPIAEKAPKPQDKPSTSKSDGEPEDL